MSIQIVPARGEPVLVEYAPVRGQFGLLSSKNGGLAGWFDPLSPRTEIVDRPQADGGFAPQSLLLSSRVIILPIVFVAASHQDAILGLQRLTSLVNQFLRIVVEHPETGQVQHAWGFVSQKVEVEWVTVQGVLCPKVTVFVTCPDPLKYSGRGESLDDWETAIGFWAEAVSGGLLFPLGDQAPRDEVTVSNEPMLLFTEGGLTNSVSCVNVGGADSWPILEATGPFEWCQWVCAGQVVRWESPVGTGATLQINTHSGEIVVGGLPGYATSLALDEFFPLVPGENVVAFQASHPSRYRVRWLSAWL